MIPQKKNRGHPTSKIIKSRQSYSNGHLLYHCSLGSSSNVDGDAEDDAWSKIYSYFTSEIRHCLELFSTPMALKPRSG